MTDDYVKLLDPTQVATEAEFEAIWERLLQAPPEKKRSSEKEKRVRISRVGTLTQRSSAVNQRKIRALMERKE